jgi:hypothetical protein
MAGLDELFNQIPTGDIARQLGADEGEVNSAVQTLVPLLVGGLRQNAQDPGHAASIENAAGTHAASGLLDGGVSVDQVDEADGSKAIAKIFGGNDSSQVAAALSGGGAGNGDLIKRLLPILAPIVLAYLGKQLSNGSGGGGVGDVLGSILGGVLGASQSGGGRGGGLGDILGGLLGAKK